MNDLNGISQEEFEKIEAYLHGELSGDEVVSFEDLLKTNPEFKTKFEDIKAVLTGIETQSMKEQLDDFHNDMQSSESELIVNEPKVRSLQWKKIAVAAVLIIGLGSFWLFNGSSNDKLYSEYFLPDPGLPTTMSSTDNYEFYEAMVDYKRGKYETAISKWESLSKAKPNNDTLNYFIGVAHLANKNENLALSYLETASKNPEFPLIDDTYYYLGLAYLKDGNVEKSKESLEKSTLENSKSLLSKLKN